MRCTVAAAVSCFVIASLSATEHAAASVRQEARIPAQSLGAALETFARTRSLQLVYATDEVESLLSFGATGNLTAEEALAQLLQGTGLSYRFLDDKTITVLPSAAYKPRLASGAATALRGTTSEGAAQRESGEKAAHATAADSRSLWPRFRLAMSAGEDQGSDRSAGASQDRIEEVVVTARRRQESQQDVPISMVAKTGEYLQQARVDTVADLDRVVPGYIFAGLTNSQVPAVFLRGIGTSANQTSVDPSVGASIDGVVQPRTSALSGEFVDVDHVEVLKGPQGTLFGKNATAGLVSIFTKDPTDTPTGSMSLGYGSYDDVKAKGTFSGPLTAALSGRLSVYANKRDGYIEDLTTGRDYIDEDQRGARAILLYRPSDATRVRFSLSAVQREINAPAIGEVHAIGARSSAGDQLLGDLAGPHNDKLVTSGGGTAFSTHKNWGATLQWDQQLGDYTLTSISSYQYWFWDANIERFALNPSALPLTLCSCVSVNTRQLTEEIRLASPIGGFIDYVAGVYLYKLRYPGELYQLIDVLPGVQVSLDTESQIDTLNYAGFGEANFHVTDEVTLIAGARWTHETKEVYVQNFPTAPGTINLLSVAVVNGEANVSNWSWRAGTTWQPTENGMLYAVVSRGFKGPVTNPNIIPTPQGPVTTTLIVRPEVATSYEIGLKSNWLDRTVRADLSLFRTDIDHYQADSFSVITLPDGSLTTLPATLDAGAIKTQGVEFELEAKPVERLTLNLLGAYTDGKYKSFDLAPCWIGQTVAQGCVGGAQNLTGTRLPLVPKYAANFSGSYKLPLAGVPFDGFLRADYTWRSEVQWSRANYAGNVEGAYGQVGATIGIKAKDDRYSLMLHGRNLTNEFHYGGLGIVSPGGIGTTTHHLAPDYQRIWGMTFNYNF